MLWREVLLIDEAINQIERVGIYRERDGIAEKWQRRVQKSWVVMTVFRVLLSRPNCGPLLRPRN